MAEVMWEAAEPCLSEEQRLAALTALHVGEPSQALLVVVTALSRSGHPLPSALHVEFQEWLRRRPGSGSPADWTLLEIRVAAADVRATVDVGMIDGRYGDATLCSSFSTTPAWSMPPASNKPTRSGNGYQLIDRAHRSERICGSMASDISLMTPTLRHAMG